MKQDEIAGAVAPVEAFINDVIASAESDAGTSCSDADLPLYLVIRYHLGWVDQTFQPVSAKTGKRIRPLVCLLCAGAAGGSASNAIPVAASIELLHNFTLMHDDIQDRSEFRHGRKTIWAHWGEAQAINVGDATFALSQLALLRLGERHDDQMIVREIATEFNKVTLRIVEGQVLDLGFEHRWDIGTDDYLRMVTGKTAAIVGFAAWAGALVATGDRRLADQYREFGLKLGLGFQVRDDYLGIWGNEADTGKPAGDDIRTRKKSIPVVMLLDRVSAREADELRHLYTSGELSPAAVDRVQELLRGYEIERDVHRFAERYHNEALELLTQIAPLTPERNALEQLAERLVERTS